MNNEHAEAVAAIEAMVCAYAPPRPKDNVYWGASSRTSPDQAMSIVKDRLKIDMSHKVAIGDGIRALWPRMTREQRIDALKAAIVDYTDSIPF